MYTVKMGRTSREEGMRTLVPLWEMITQKRKKKKRTKGWVLENTQGQIWEFKILTVFSFKCMNFVLWETWKRGGLSWNRFPRSYIWKTNGTYITSQRLVREGVYVWCWTYFLYIFTLIYIFLYSYMKKKF